MKLHLIPLLALSSLCLLSPLSAQQADIPNRLIDYPGFLQDAEKVGKLRTERRVTESDFIRLAAEAGTIVLDARSAEKFAQIHIEGAKNLSLPDVTAAELAKIIPDKNTRVLIYCNNNFENEAVAAKREALVSKSFRASLNIYTFNTLYSYGYQNVYELGPVIDLQKTILPLAGTLKPGKE